MTLDELIEAALKAKQTLGGEARVSVYSDDEKDEIDVFALDSRVLAAEFQILI